MITVTSVVVENKAEDVCRTVNVLSGLMMPMFEVHAPPLIRYSPPDTEMIVPESIPVTVTVLDVYSVEVAAFVTGVNENASGGVTLPDKFFHVEDAACHCFGLPDLRTTMNCPSFREAALSRSNREVEVPQPAGLPSKSEDGVVAFSQSTGS